MNKTRIQLRKFKASDGKDLYAYLSHEKVIKYEPYGIQCKEECLILAKKRATSECFLAIETIKEKKVIGNMYMAPIGPKKFKTWMIGYVLNAEYWGQGYGTESLKALLAFLFHEKNAHRVIAKCNTQNKKSWQLLERNGFRREGLYKKNAYFGLNDQGEPDWHDSFHYSLLREELCSE